MNKNKPIATITADDLNNEKHDRYAVVTGGVIITGIVLVIILCVILGDMYEQ